jgi:hypothetical protein
MYKCNTFSISLDRELIASKATLSKTRRRTHMLYRVSSSINRHYHTPLIIHYIPFVRTENVFMGSAIPFPCELGRNSVRASEKDARIFRP